MYYFWVSIRNESPVAKMSLNISAYLKEPLPPYPSNRGR